MKKNFRFLLLLPFILNIAACKEEPSKDGDDSTNKQSTDQVEAQPSTETNKGDKTRARNDDAGEGPSGDRSWQSKHDAMHAKNWKLQKLAGEGEGGGGLWQEFAGWWFLGWFLGWWFMGHCLRQALG